MSESTPPGHSGPQLSRNQKIGAATAAAAVAGLLWYRSRQNAAAAAAVPASDQVDAASTDPLGMSSDTGPGVYGTTGTAASSTTVGTVATNQDWYSAALSAAEDAGYNAGTAAAALGAYLGHQPLTAAQQGIVRIGLAAAGTPPVGTFTIITAPAPVPPATAPVSAPGGLHVIALGTTSFTLTWNGQANAHGYYVYTDGHRSTRLYGTTWTVNAGHAGFAIKPGTRHSVSVTAVDAAGKEGPHSAAVTVTTKKK